MELRPGTPKEAAMLPERIERARDLCAGWVKSGHTPALVVLVARQGVIVLHEAFGRLRPEDDSSPLESDSLFLLASLTKPITATAAMILVEDGLLGLNRPVVDYLPELHGERTEQVLVHHLLTHTSGFNDEEIEPFTERKFNEGPVDMTAGDETQHPLIHALLALRWSVPLWKPPGVEMAYSNHNYLLLGEIIRRVSGRSLDDFANERMFAPLGMRDTYYVVPESVRSRVVKRPPEAAWNQPEGLRPAIDSRQVEEIPAAWSGVFSTAMDLAIFGQTLLNGGSYRSTRLLSCPSVAAMTRNQIPGIGTNFFGTVYREASYGYGWFVETDEKWKYLNGSLQPLGAFSHAGATGVMLWIDPVQEIVGVYLSVLMEMTEELLPLWNLDLFQNVITSAVED